MVPKDAAEEAVYGFDDAASANTLEVLVHRLRKRLDAAGSSVRIHTLRGLGYLLDGGDGDGGVGDGGEGMADRAPPAAGRWPAGWRCARCWRRCWCWARS
ncbi:helix-turn-helix domain-containing protein [Tistrella bauzanensis]